MRKGLTLIELMITVVMIVILTGVTVYIFRAILLSWSGAETRAGIDIGLDRGVEETVRDLREAKLVCDNPGCLTSDISNNNEIRFRQDKSTDGINYITYYYIYYLYNSGDTYTNPRNFNQSSYQLRKATLSGGIDDPFTGPDGYGSGNIIISDVLSPNDPLSPSTLSVNTEGKIVTIDLSVKRKDETIRSKTQVRPRNL